MRKHSRYDKDSSKWRNSKKISELLYNLKEGTARVVLALLVLFIKRSRKQQIFFHLGVQTQIWEQNQQEDLGHRAVKMF